MTTRPHLRSHEHEHEVEALEQRYVRVRGRTVALTRTLAPEDMVVQSMPEASPGKWHLAHTTWFFEQFILAPRELSYRAFDPSWQGLFNSYYHSVGPMHARPRRGLLTRPPLAQVGAYRDQVDQRVLALLHQRGDDAELAFLIELGLNHEQQHQELLLTDIKHAFWSNPLLPEYAAAGPWPVGRAIDLRFLPGPEGTQTIGHAGDAFAFDNETPQHHVLLHPHAVANRPVSNAEYAQFIADGGYRRPELWLSDGWITTQRENWQRPLYWSEGNDSAFTLSGTRALDPHAPVCHVSFFESDAFARWAGYRLPTEAEWEVLAAEERISGNFQDAGVFHPLPANGSADDTLQLFGDVWEWTSSPYLGYPGYRPWSGALGEYNGKFMCNQWVLRGGSCATPADHIRASYRNFFYPHDRWQFMGIRLGRDR
jgi:ergothioneine biosynthesis protein EgtB